MNSQITGDLTSFSTVFQTYQGDVRVKMKFKAEYIGLSFTADKR